MGKLYWTTPATTDTQSMAWRANLDGGARGSLPVTVPEGDSLTIVAVAPTSGKMYLTHSSSAGVTGKIARANLDGN